MILKVVSIISKYFSNYKDTVVLNSSRKHFSKCHATISATNRYISQKLHTTIVLLTFHDVRFFRL